METIPKSECEKIGFFRKTHGIHGGVVLEFEPEYELSLEETDKVFIELEGLLVPFFILDDNFRFKSGNSAIIQFENTETDKYAKRLIGKSAYLFKADIIHDPEIDNSGGFEGFQIFDKNIGLIGTVRHVDDYSGNVVFTVDYKNKDILIPFNDDLVVELDHSLKKIILNIPEGLLEG